MLAGDVTPDPQAYQGFKQSEQTLQTAASAEAQVVNRTAQESPIIANTLESRSPVLTGWRAYGRAVGLAKRTAAFSQIMLQEFMMSDALVVPINRPDGTVEMISPKRAGYSGDMAEIAAAQRVGLQQLISSAGISGLNPVILAEHLTPTVMNVQAAIASNRASEVRKYRQEEARAQVNETVAYDFFEPKVWESPQSRFDWLQGLAKRLEDTGLSRPESKKILILDLIRKSVATRDLDKLRQLKETQYRDNDPGLIGDVFMVEIAEAEDNINGAVRRAYEQNLIDLDRGAERMMAEYDTRLRAGEDAGALGREYMSAFDELGKAGSLKALDYAKQLALGGDYNPYVARAYQDRIASGDFPTPEELALDRRLGRINASEERNILDQMPTSEAQKTLKMLAPEAQTAAEVAILDNAKFESGVYELNKAKVRTRANILAEEAIKAVREELRLKPDLSTDELRQIMENKVKALVVQPRFKFNQDGTPFSETTDRGSEAVRANYPSSGPAPAPRQQAPRAFLNPAQLRQVQSANSRAAAILSDANSTPTQQARALIDANASIQRNILRRQMQAQQQNQQALPSGIGPAAQALMDFIGNAEGGGQQWNAVNRGTAGDTPDGMPGLSNMTIGQIMAMQQKGTINAAGRYQFVKDPLRETVAQLGLSPTTKFTPDVQNQLFMARIQSPVRAALRDYINGSSNNIDAALRDLSNEFAVVKPPGGGRGRYDNIAGNRASLLDSDAARLLNSLRAENMRLGFSGARGPIYQVDSLGYGSTGPHIDVKPVKRGSTETDSSISYQKGTLDRFVEIRLPTGRRGPLSALATTTDDDRLHRARGSFGHDYAAERGSQVFLKNGARVVASFKGDQGTDHLIVELPDGRRFQFLHGTKL